MWWQNDSLIINMNGCSITVGIKKTSKYYSFKILFWLKYVFLALNIMSLTFDFILLILRCFRWLKFLYQNFHLQVQPYITTYILMVMNINADFCTCLLYFYSLDIKALHLGCYSLYNCQMNRLIKYFLIFIC